MEARLVTRNLIADLKDKFETSREIYILSSFVMKSGVELLKPYLDLAVNKGSDIKICAGDYLYITQPQALKELLKYKDQVEVRIWRSSGEAFHPKAYLFENQNAYSLYVGSSNLSKSALTSGIEWNLALEGEEVIDAIYNDATKNFMEIFLNEQTMPLNEETYRLYEKDYEKYHHENPQASLNWTAHDEIHLTVAEELLPYGEIRDIHKNDEDKSSEGNAFIQPRDAQIGALESIQTSIEEGYEKALVVMATGLGKTYLSAFVAQNYKKVLFIAHREEILNQAKKSFSKVYPEKESAIFNGKNKDVEQKDFIFASIYTLAKKQNLEKFKTDEFQFIVIDEFHHAAAKTYEKVVDYFKPQFMLGITATPYRLDGKDIYGICDGNLAYQMDFIEAIRLGWLSPFQYYGVHDEIDYSNIKWLGSRYDENELLAYQLKKNVAQNIYSNWLKHKQTRTIAFCSSIVQAQFLSDYFLKMGRKSTCLTSRSSSDERQKAIFKLNQNEIEIIFTVDLFNEGVDIPSVDTILIVRPTESLTVFVQQIGRALRKHPGKNHSVIIDLIGNYRNADNKFSVFSDEQSSDILEKVMQNKLKLPEGCLISLETDVVDILKALGQKTSPRKERVKQAYDDLKLELGRRPQYLELHLKANIDSKVIVQEFKSYLGFLAWHHELTEDEQAIYMKFKSLIEEVERTSMTKSYKMVLLHTMLSKNQKQWYKKISPHEIAEAFYNFYMSVEYRKRIDFSDKSSIALWDYNVNKISNLIARMPMTKWSSSSSNLALYDGSHFSFNIQVNMGEEKLLYSWIKEICDYRIHSYFQKKSN